MALDLTFDSWSGMGQPEINYTPPSLGFGVPSLGSFAGSVATGAARGGLVGAITGGASSFFNPSFGSFSMGGTPVNPVTPGQVGANAGFGSGDGSGVTQGPNGAFYSPAGNPLFQHVGGDQYLDINTGQLINQVQAQALAGGGGAQQYRAVPGGFVPVGPNGEAVSAQFFTSLPPGGQLVGGAAEQPGFSAQNPLVPVSSEPFSFPGAGGSPVAGGEPLAFSMPNSFYEARAKRAEAFSKSAMDLEAQAAQFDFAPLAKARMEAFKTAEMDLERRAGEAVGTVADQLSRRRVLGASFSDRQILDTQRTYEQAQRDLSVKKAEMMAASTLEEMGIKTDLLTKANALRIQAFDEDVKNVIQESGIQAELARTGGLINADLAKTNAAIAAEMSRTFATLSEANLRTRIMIAAQEAQSIRSAIYGERASNNQTAAFTAAQEAARDQRTSQGIGGLIGGILTAPIAGGNSGGSFIGNLLNRLF